jgi:glutamyl-tRNA reductase
VKLLALGVDYHRAPAALREALAFDGPRLTEGLTALGGAFPGNEFVLLSTCNRVELYLAASDPHLAPEVSSLADFMAHFHNLAASSFMAHLVDHHDAGAVNHLFRVAASLESLVLGEGQILHQVKEAYEAANKSKVVGPILHYMFQQALRVGKKVREATGMDQGKLSIASVAVDMAKAVFDTFSDKTVLVIGAGKMGDLTLQHLAALRPGRLLVTNRDPERALEVASRWGGTSVPFEHLYQALIAADLVISTTAAPEPIITLEPYRRVQRARRNRLALILDIAIPRDFDPSIGKLEQVYLYNVDDLQAQAEQNRQGREKGIGLALTIIERETITCLNALHHQLHAGAVLRQLGDYADGVLERELSRLFSSHPELSPSQQEAIAHFARRLQNQYLHHPRAALRSVAEESAKENPHPLLSTVRHLFGLADG